MNAAQPDREHVVLTHGLLLNRWCLGVLRRRLESAGLNVHVFGYRTRKADLDSHAGDLARFVDALGISRVHAVGHSLGGLVIARAMHRHDLPPGRLVLLGSPMRGSAAARRVARLRMSGLLLGGVGPALYRGQALPSDRETGLVLGRRNLGVGRLLGVQGPADGTVAEREAWRNGAKDVCLLPVTHTSMLFSKLVAGEISSFVSRGQFTSVFRYLPEDRTGLRKPPAS